MVGWMISGLHIRAARALLRWSSGDLAEASEVGIATIKRYELTDGVPSGNTHTLGAIQAALEAAGIEFIGTAEDGPGVRLKPKTSR